MTTNVAAILQHLNDQQKYAVTFEEKGSVLVSAGPGSGKTRVVISLTFTKKAANEMRQRLYDLQMDPISVSTIHSYCNELLRKHGHHLNIPSNFSICDGSEALALIKKCVATVCQSTFSDPISIPLKYIATIISKAKNECQSPEDYERRNDPSNRTTAFVAAVYRLYDRKKQEGNLLDFDDMLYCVAHLLTNFNEVRQIISENIQYLLVDEMQDTSRLQLDIIFKLSSVNKNVFAVGDCDQVIYEWRQADSENMKRFISVLNAKKINLEQNYRSTSNILKVATELFRNEQNREKKVLFTTDSSGSPVVLRRCLNPQEEAAFVVNTIKSLKQMHNLQWNDFAILYRQSRQSLAFESTLKRNQVPVSMVGGYPFYERKEIKDLNCYLRFAVNTSDVQAFERIINYPKRGMGEKSIETVLSFWRQLKKKNTHMTILDCLRRQHDLPLTTTQKNAVRQFCTLFDNLHKQINSGVELMELVKYLVKHLDYENYLSEGCKGNTVVMETKLGNIEELKKYMSVMEHQLIVDSNDNNCTTNNVHLSKLSSFLSIVVSGNTSVGDDEEDKQDPEESKSESKHSVNLSTIHAAKGLEWHTVFIVGCEEGICPISNSSNMSEELRLYYVASTRARKCLYFTYCYNRLGNDGSERCQTRSRFLRPLDDLPMSTVEKYNSHDKSCIEEDSSNNYQVRSLINQYNHPGGSQKAIPSSMNSVQGYVNSTNGPGGFMVASKLLLMRGSEFLPPKAEDKKVVGSNQSHVKSAGSHSILNVIPRIESQQIISKSSSQPNNLHTHSMQQSETSSVFSKGVFTQTTAQQISSIIPRQTVQNAGKSIVSKSLGGKRRRPLLKHLPNNNNRNDN